MQWLIPAFVFVLAVFFCWMSLRTDDRVAAWARVVLAAIFLVIAAAVSIVVAVQ